MKHTLRVARHWAKWIALVTIACSVRASNFVASELIAIDASQGTTSDSINDLEIYRQGLFWTTPSLSGGVEFSHQGSAAFIGYRLGPISSPYYAHLSGHLLTHAVRDDSYLYYTEPGGVHRKPINGDPSAEGGLIGGGWNVNQPGALMTYNGRVYCAMGDTSAFGNEGNLTIEYFDAPGVNGVFQVPIKVAHGRDLGGNPGAVTKMAVAYRRLAGVSSLVPYGLALTTQGQLLRFELEGDFFSLFGGAVVIASDVADFAVRREQFYDSSRLRLPYEQDAIYAAIGRFQCAGDARAKLVSLDPISDAQSVVWTAPDGARLLAVGTDDQYLFVSTIQATAASGFGCTTIGDGVIRSKLSPAFPRFLNLNPDANWDPIELTAGSNLRSDGQYLYFTYEQQIRRMATTSPRIRLDIAAVGLEAVQAIQDFNNSVPLVQGKSTIVRAYGKVVENSKGLANLQVSASLRAYKDGIELPGSPVFAANYPALDTVSDLATLRTDRSRSFYFAMPQSWLVPGTVNLNFTVNPFNSLPESADALVNNTASAAIKVVPGRQPSLVFEAMSSTHPNYSPNNPGSGFADILDRAKSLLPVSGFKVYLAAGSVTKPVVTLFGIKGRSFNMPDDKTWALIWMAVENLLSSDPGPDSHWVGMFPPEDAPFNGIGGARGVKLSDLIGSNPIDFTIPHTALDNTVVVRMSAGQGNSPNAWGTVVGGHTLAHELGHNYGRFHIRQPASCGAQSPDRPWQPYPADPCTLGITDLNDPGAPIGWDRRTGTLILPNMAGDLMSYADSDWISPHTWNALVDAIPVTGVDGLVSPGSVTPQRKDDLNPQPLPPHDPVFVWQGLIRTDSDTATLLPGFRLPRGTIDPAKVQRSLDVAAALPAAANYRLRLFGDPNAAPIDERPVTFVGAAEGDGAAMIFAQAMPDIGTGTKLQILSGTRVIAESTASPNLPVLTLDTPNIDSTNRTVGLTWAATDADNDPLLFTVQYSADNGTNWLTLKVNDPETSLAISSEHLHGGDTCLLRVLASDGFNTTIATTSPFVLPKLGPSITLTGLVAGQRVPFGGGASVRIFAYDAEDGSLSDSALAWSIAGSTGKSGVGSELKLDDLPPGPCTLAVTATDSEQNVTTTTVSFEVLPVAVPEVDAPVLDGVGSDAGYFTAPTIRLQSGQAEPSLRLIHNGGILYASFSGLPISDPGASIGATIQLAIDTTLAGETKPGSGAVEFGVSQDGVPSQGRGNTVGFVPDTLSPDFHTAIARSGSTWSAELAIPDGLLGGWNHNVGIAVQMIQWTTIPAAFGPPITTLGQAFTWPYGGDFSGPATWAGTTLGTGSGPLSNRPPVAIAAGPSVVALEDTRFVALDGTGSFDPDADPLTYNWSQVSGPAVDLQGATTASPTFGASVGTDPVTLVFQLIVNDGLADSAPATVQVNLVPVATVDTGGGLGLPSVGDNGGPAGGVLSWPGSAGGVVTVQASTNLFDWVDIQTNSVGFLQSITFNDPDAGLYSQRFYRLHDWSAPTPDLTGGTALQFDGSGGTVTVPDNAAFDTLPISIMAWINTTQSTGAYPGIITKYEGGQAHGFALGLDAGRFDPWYYANAAEHIEELTGTGLDGRFVADGQWHHLAYVVSLDGAQIYIDGVLMNSLAWIGTPTPTTTTVPLVFGKYDGGSALPFAGILDEVSIWNRALTVDDVHALMGHPASGTESGLSGLWHFDETDPGVAADSTGNGNDGVIVSGVLRTPSTAPLH